MKRVYIAESSIDSTLLHNQLVEAGVPAVVFHQNAVGALGELPVTYPEVWIRRADDQERAARVIQQFEQQSSIRRTQHCQQCGESSPGNFEICWNCHGVFSIS